MMRYAPTGVFYVVYDDEENRISNETHASYILALKARNELPDPFRYHIVEMTSSGPVAEVIG